MTLRDFMTEYEHYMYIYICIYNSERNPETVSYILTHKQRNGSFKLF